MCFCKMVYRGVVGGGARVGDDSDSVDGVDGGVGGGVADDGGAGVGGCR